MTPSSRKLDGARILFVSSTSFNQRTRELREAYSLHDAGAEIFVYGYADEVPTMFAEAPFTTAVHVPAAYHGVTSHQPRRALRIAANLTINALRNAWQLHVRCPHDRARFRAEAVRLKPDAVHAMDLPSLADAARIARACRVPLLYDASEYWRGFAESPVWRFAPEVPAGYLADEQRYIREAAAVFSVSESMTARLSADYHITTCHPLYNAPLMHGFEPHPHPTGTPVRLVFHGSVSPDRNVEGLLRAIALLPAHVTLDIHGRFIDDLEHICRGLIDELDLGDRVHIHGAYSWEEVLDFLPHYDLEVYTATALDANFGVSLPNKVLDSVCLGVALAVPDFEELTHFIKTTGAGVCIDTSTPEHIAAGLLPLVEHPERIDTCKAKAAAASKEYCWERQGERLVAIYRSILEKSHVL